ncbi:MAG: capsule assembly Wzi family protein, partial [Acinetobacter sp.]
RPESLSSLWDAFVGNKDNGGTGEPDPSNQIAGFDARLNLFPLVQVPMGLYGQYVGEDEAGGLPAKKMYLAGVDYSASIRNMPYQLYAEWADTRTNGKVRGVSYNHSTYTDGFYQHGYPLAHALGGDAQMVSVGGDIRIDPMNRLSGRVLFADVNQSERAAKNNTAFAFDDKIKALDVTWSHYIRPEMPLKINAWVSDSDVNGQDGGASLGIEIPLEKGLFKY